MRARAALLAVAALSVCASHGAHPPPAAHPRLKHIKGQILAKLGLSAPPTPVGAPPRDVVRQILARAARADPPAPHPEPHADEMREVIAIAHRGGGNSVFSAMSNTRRFSLFHFRRT